MRLSLIALIAVLALAPVPAVASAGDLASVEKYCGKPINDKQEVSQVTNKMERDLTYGPVILHFLPVENGWSFLSGWYNHLPLTRDMAENHMPCFAQAMASVQTALPVAGTAYEDPAIRAQTADPSAETRDFGIPHLRLILVLSAIVVICFFLPSARRRQPRPMEMDRLRQRRKPLLHRFARRSPTTRLDV